MRKQSRPLARNTRANVPSHPILETNDWQVEPHLRHRGGQSGLSHVPPRERPIPSHPTLETNDWQVEPHPRHRGGSSRKAVGPFARNVNANVPSHARQNERRRKRRQSHRKRRQSHRKRRQSHRERGDRTLTLLGGAARQRKIE